MSPTPREPRKPGLDASESLVEAVLDDGVVQAAIDHVSEEPTPSRIAAKEVAATRVSDETSLRTSGQRKINLIWEVTQAIVTVMVVGATLYIAGRLAISDSTDRTVAFLLLSNAFFMIVTFYYQRTNHIRTGGVGGRDVDTDR